MSNSIMQDYKNLVFQNDKTRASIQYDHLVENDSIIKFDATKKVFPYELSNSSVNFTSKYISNFTCEEVFKKLGNECGITSHHTYRNNIPIQLFLNMYRFFHTGQKVIQCNDVYIQTLLECTKLNDIPMESIDIPFSSFYVNIDKVLESSIGMGDKYKVFIDGAFITSCQSHLYLNLIFCAKNERTNMGYIECLPMKINKVGSLPEFLKHCMLPFENSVAFTDIVVKINKDVLSYSLEHIFKIIILFQVNSKNYCIKEKDKRVQLLKKTNSKVLKKFGQFNHYFTVEYLKEKSAMLLQNKKDSIHSSGTMKYHENKIVYLEPKIKS